MTRIDLYGVSSGRSIADAIDDDDERLRQRRLSVEQKAKQDRRSFALTDRLIQPEISQDLPVQQQTMHGRRSISQRPSGFGGGGSSQSPLRRSLETVKSHFPDLHPDIEDDSDCNFAEVQQQRRAAQTADSARRVLVNPKTTEQVSERNQSSMIQSPASPKLDYSAKNDLRSEVSLPEERAGSDAGIEHSPTHPPSISSIVDSLNDLRGTQFAERLSDKLSELLTHLRAHSESSCDLKERDELQASIEFLEGYIEATDLEPDARQQLTELTSKVRQQLLADIPNSLIYQQLILAPATLSHGGARIQFGDAVVPNKRNSIKDRAAYSKSNVAVAEDVEQGMLGSNVSASRSECQAVQRSSESSLSKDQEKRREETLVSVTVRAV